VEVEIIAEDLMRRVTQETILRQNSYCSKKYKKIKQLEYSPLLMFSLELQHPYFGNNSQVNPK